MATNAFSFQSTTDEVLDDIDLRGTLAVVTGGTSGLGAETARALASRGAHVVLTGRDLDKANRVADAVAAQTGADAPEVEQLELASLGGVRDFTTRFLDRHDRLDLLVNNAGVMACPYDTTEDGFERQFGVNHLGHFLLTNLLTPALLAGAPSRVVSVSSAAHRNSPVVFDDVMFEERPYDPWIAYGQSKTANVLFAVEFDRRFGDRGVHAYAVHPGVIQTELGRHLTAEDMARFAAALEAGAMALKTVEQGAAIAVYAATATELDERGGVYLEDAGIAPVVDDRSDAPGVYRWAVDADTARRLWEVSERLVGQTFDH